MLLLGTHGVVGIILTPREYVEFEIPAPFRRVVLNALTASPASVDIRSQSAQFYVFAEKVMNLWVDFLSQLTP